MIYKYDLWPWKVISHVFDNYHENYERYRNGLHYGHIGNHIWAFISCYDLWPWMSLKGQTSKSMHFASCILKKNSFQSSVVMKKRCSHLQLLFTNMTSDLERLHHVFSANISKLWEIQKWFVLGTYRKAYIGFHFVLWPMTLDDLKRSNEQNYAF